MDDKLPVRQGRLLFSYSHTRNEYWSALVEKAYAKSVATSSICFWVVMSESTHSLLVCSCACNYSHLMKNIQLAVIIFSPFLCRLVGCYGSLRGGNISEGMEDFTGGIAYSMKVSSRSPRVLWRSLTAALSRGSLLSCFIQVHAHLTMFTLHTWKQI